MQTWQSLLKYASYIKPIMQVMPHENAFLSYFFCKLESVNLISFLIFYCCTSAIVLETCSASSKSLLRPPKEGKCCRETDQIFGDFPQPQVWVRECVEFICAWPLRIFKRRLLHPIQQLNQTMFGSNRWQNPAISHKFKITKNLVLLTQ